MTTSNAYGHTLKIAITMKGEAFAEYPTEEVQRILTEIVGRLDSLGVEHYSGRGPAVELFTLYDVNGNSVGAVTVGRVAGT